MLTNHCMYCFNICYASKLSVNVFGMKKNKSYPAEFHIFWSIQVLKYVLLQAENYDYVDIWVTSLQKDEKLPIAFDHRGLTDPEIFYVFSLIMTPRPQNQTPLKRWFMYLCIYIYIYIYISIFLSCDSVRNYEPI